MNEQQMTTLVRRVGETLEPDVAALVAGGTARGRVRRRRRRAGTGLAGVATIAAVATLGYGLAPGGDASWGPADPSTATAQWKPPTRHFATDPYETGTALASLVSGRVTDVQWSTDAPVVIDGGLHALDYRAGSLLLDGAMVEVILEEEPGSTCPLAGGHCIDVTQMGQIHGPTDARVVANTATLTTHDGFHITVTAWNARTAKDAEPVMARPVLSSSQLADIAQSGIWLEYEQ